MTAVAITATSIATPVDRPLCIRTAIKPTAAPTEGGIASIASGSPEHAATDPTANSPSAAIKSAIVNNRMTAYYPFAKTAIAATILPSTVIGMTVASTDFS